MAFIEPEGMPLKTDGKAANFGSQDFLLFIQCFPEFQWQILPI